MLGLDIKFSCRAKKQHKTWNETSNEHEMDEWCQSYGLYEFLHDHLYVHL